MGAVGARAYSSPIVDPLLLLRICPFLNPLWSYGSIIPICECQYHEMEGCISVVKKLLQSAVSFKPELLMILNLSLLFCSCHSSRHQLMHDEEEILSASDSITENIWLSMKEANIVDVKYISKCANIVAHELAFHTNTSNSMEFLWNSPHNFVKKKFMLDQFQQFS